MARWRARSFGPLEALLVSGALLLAVSSARDLFASGVGVVPVLGMCLVGLLLVQALESVEARRARLRSGHDPNVGLRPAPPTVAGAMLILGVAILALVIAQIA